MRKEQFVPFVAKPSADGSLYHQHRKVHVLVLLYLLYAFFRLDSHPHVLTDQRLLFVCVGDGPGFLEALREGPSPIFDATGVVVADRGTDDPPTVRFIEV